MGELTDKARAFAIKAHDKQTRFNKAKTPLTDHLEEVVALVTESGGTDEEIAAAWLHDVVEDTPVTLDEIAENFGQDVASIVAGFTDPPEFKALHTLDRKTRQAERIRSKNDSVKRVKIADQISNVRSIAVDPPVKWNTQKCLDYAEGALKIVSECYGVSDMLFEEFTLAYLVAVGTYCK